MADDHWLTTFFSTGLYTIDIEGEGTDAIYSVNISLDSEKVPLALLVVAYQIAFSDVAAYKAEAYMEKIEANQELQSATNTAIALAESLQEDVYATTSSFISANSDWVTMDAWSATHDAGTNYDYALGTLLPDFLADEGYVAVSGDTLSCSYVFVNEGNTAVWTLTGISVLDSAGNVYEIDVTYTVQRATENDNVTTPFVVNGGEFTIASGDGVDDATTNVLNTTLTNDIIKACVLADITEIGGVALYEVDDNGDATYTIVNDEIIYNSDVTLTSDQLDTLLEELELAYENASSSTQTDMVYAEEYLGQYNSYLSGSSSTLDDYNSSLMSIAGRIG